MVDSEEVDQRRWMSQTKTLPSLKCNGHEALLLFVHPDYLFTFMVSKYCIEAFNKKGKKVLESRFKVKWKHAPEDISGGSRLPFVHLGGEGNPHVPAALSARFLRDQNEVIVGHVDNVVRRYSLRKGHMGSLTREISLKFSPTAMTTLTQDQTLVSGSKGALCLIPSGDGEQIIQSQTKFPFPEQLKATCATSCKVRGKANPHVFLGFENGFVAATRANDVGDRDDESTLVFSAHYGQLLGIASLFEGKYILTGGQDGTVAVFGGTHGRCLARKSLGFPIAALESPREDPNHTLWSGSTTAIVAGSHGHVVVLKVSIFAECCAQIGEIAKVLAGTQIAFSVGRQLSGVSFCSWNGVLSACTNDGLLHQWCLALSVSRQLGLSQEEIDESNLASSDELILTKRARLGSMKVMLDGQEVLQFLLETSMGLPESTKDALVAEFERLQTTFQAKVVKLEEAYIEKRSSLVGQIERVREKKSDPEFAQHMLKSEELTILPLDHKTKVREVSEELLLALAKAMKQTLRKATGDAAAVKEAKDRIQRLGSQA
eukprot:CAMPEP_0113971178 /NCGR_PEP_ID=MMETSP0011_2-20120614/12015_1 /TAXON_ID=101924 /ORGANISM="Rhodosorus marinus" /LENGTH=544 /DNA_ID=CAMNT_0000986491 /DNA_START=64 /DNA_END=1698 /DNA_ORIENTATION=- /assembly_acc=CAM_ASM_000156